MARGGRSGKKRTQYVRDAQGRFASAPGGKKATPSAVRKAAKAATLKGGTLAARTSLKKSRTKLAAIDKADETLKTTLSRRAQKGAVTRGQKAARAAIKSSQSKLNIAPKTSTIKKRRTMREMSKIVKDATPKVAGAKERGKVKGSAKSRAMIKTEHGGSLVDPVKREPRKAPNRIGISRKGFAQIKKPANLAAGGIERAKLAKASKDYRKIDKRMSRRDANYRRLQSEMSLAVMRRDQNPYPKGMAGKKEKVRRQGEVDKIQKRINKQNMAWMTYSLQQKSVDEALKLISQIRANAKLLKKTTKKRARYQGSLLGGTDVSY